MNTPSSERDVGAQVLERPPDPTGAWQAAYLRAAQVTTAEAQLTTGQEWKAVIASDLAPVDPAQVLAVNRLLAARIGGEFDYEGQPWTWRIGLVPRLRSPIALRIDESGDRATLVFSTDSPLLPVLPGSWQSLSAEAHLLAVTIAMEPLVHSLGARLNVVWTPYELVGNGSVASALGPFAIGVDVFDTGGQKRDQMTLSCALSVFGAATAAMPPARPESVAKVYRLAAELPIEISAMTVNAAELAGLAQGDVLMLESAAAIGDGCDVYVRAGMWRVEAQWKGRALHVSRVGRVAPSLGIAQRLFDDGATMKDESRNQPAAATPADARSNGAAKITDMISVPVSMEVGAVVLTVDEIIKLVPGMVVPVAKELDRNAITVKANGQVIATGELVQLGKQLGVRVTSIANA